MGIAWMYILACGALSTSSTLVGGHQSDRAQRSLEVRETQERKEERSCLLELVTPFTASYQPEDTGQPTYIVDVLKQRVCHFSSESITRTDESVGTVTLFTAQTGPPIMDTQKSD